MRTTRRVLGTGVAAAAVLVLVTGWPAGAQEPAAPDRGLYEVHGADSAAERTDVARTGVDVLGVQDGATR